MRLIDADALDVAITVDYYEHFTRCHDSDQIALIDMVRDDIAESPTVDASPVVHGRWIKDKSGVIYCSECGEEHEWLDFRATYCDACGAKMDKED